MVGVRRTGAAAASVSVEARRAGGGGAEAGHLGFGRTVASEMGVPNRLVKLV